MEFLQILGLLAIFVFIYIIDKPKLNATANKKKYTVVYTSILAIGLVVGTLEVFHWLPYLNSSLVSLYKQFWGNVNN